MGGGSQTGPSRPTATSPAAASNTIAPPRSVTITWTSRRLIPASDFATSSNRIVIFPNSGAPFTPRPGSVYSRLVSIGRPFSVTLPGLPALVNAGWRLASHEPSAFDVSPQTSRANLPSAFRIETVFASMLASGRLVSVVCAAPPPSTATVPVAASPVVPPGAAWALGHGEPPIAGASLRCPLAAVQPAPALQLQLASACAAPGAPSDATTTTSDISCRRAPIVRSIPGNATG